MIPLDVTRGARHRNSKNQKVQEELLKVQQGGHQYFKAQDLAKRTNHVTNGIGNVLRFTSGVVCEGKGLWRFTGEKVEVLA